MDFFKQNRFQALMIIISAIGLLTAYLSWLAFEGKNYGNALIFAGGALLMTLMPFLQIKAEMFTKSMAELASEAVRDPLPLKFRFAIGLCWLLVISGFVSFFL